MILSEEIIEKKPGFIRVSLPEIDGSYELSYSPSLVQAIGKSCDIAFCFRAKNGEWEFETEDEHGHSFPVSDPRYCSFRDRFDESKSNAMSVQWATRILQGCLKKWWERIP